MSRDAREVWGLGNWCSLEVSGSEEDRKRLYELDGREGRCTSSSFASMALTLPMVSAWQSARVACGG